MRNLQGEGKALQNALHSELTTLRTQLEAAKTRSDAAAARVETLETDLLSIKGRSKSEKAKLEAEFATQLKAKESEWSRKYQAPDQELKAAMIKILKQEATRHLPHAPPSPGRLNHPDRDHEESW
jgi:capsule polysaccharide export protein KpsE/RkpR